MTSKWHWLVLQVLHRLWFRATLFALLALVTALMAIALRRFIPSDFEAKIGADAVDNILNIMAASMLTVTTFSLSVMVAAYGSATTSATPRATRLLIEDSTTQNVLATFIGSFLFSLVGIIALSAGAYGGSGRVVLFVVTLVVIALIVATIVRWADYLTRFGRVGETTHRVELATASALAARLESPSLGGHPIHDMARELPAERAAVSHDKIGYVQHIDMAMLSEVAEEEDVRLYLMALPGTFVHPASPIVFATSALSDDAIQRLRGSYIVDEERSFDQDPRFGFVVLAEIASRALSPAVNDAGTAIDVIGRAVRLLLEYAHGNDAGNTDAPSFDRLHVPVLRYDDMLDDVFDPIMRDGAGSLATQVRLQKALAALMASTNADLAAAAQALADRALLLAAKELPLPADMELLRDIHAGGAPTPLPAARA